MQSYARYCLSNKLLQYGVPVRGTMCPRRYHVVRKSVFTAKNSKPSAASTTDRVVEVFFAISSSVYRSLKGPLLQTRQHSDLFTLHFDLTGFTMNYDAGGFSPQTLKTMFCTSVQGCSPPVLRVRSKVPRSAEG